jgi:hypothetical protein
MIQKSSILMYQLINVVFLQLIHFIYIRDFLGNFLAFGDYIKVSVKKTLNQRINFQKKAKRKATYNKDKEM